MRVYCLRIIMLLLVASLLLAAEDSSSVFSLRQKVIEQEERIDGLTTIVEGLSASLHALQTKQSATASNKVSEHDVLLQKLAKMIDHINADYVTKSDLKKALKALKNEKSKVSGVVKKIKKPATIYSEGVRFFIKKRYDEAKKRFLSSAEKQYKTAASNYYLGEIAYYTKQYKDAIFYFKKSTEVYDKASYMDTLLLHTAISLDKTGQKNKARMFYRNIIEHYQGKKTARIAKIKLQKLQE